MNGIHEFESSVFHIFSFKYKDYFVKSILIRFLPYYKQFSGG